MDEYIVDGRLEVRASRLWALLHFNLTHLLFPASMTADHIGISTNIVSFWLTPWRARTSTFRCHTSPRSRTSAA